MASVRQIGWSTFFATEPIQSRTVPKGEWMWLDGEKSWIWANIECTANQIEEPMRQSYYPTEKACYSHSPPDMKLSMYNHKRHQIMFFNQGQRLFFRLQKVAEERMSMKL